MWVDSGHDMYRHLLQLDAFHSNRIMLAFVRTLMDLPCRSGSERRNPWAGSLRTTADGGGGGGGGGDDDDAEAPLLFVEARSLEGMRARTRWHLAYTLIHNPGLKALRVRVDGVVSVTLTSPPGLVVDTSVHAWTGKRGIEIKEIRQGGPADVNGNIQVGMYVHTINGAPVAGKNKAHWRQVVDGLPPGSQINLILHPPPDNSAVRRASIVESNNLVDGEPAHVQEPPGPTATEAAAGHIHARLHATTDSVNAHEATDAGAGAAPPNEYEDYRGGLPSGGSVNGGDRPV